MYLVNLVLICNVDVEEDSFEQEFAEIIQELRELRYLHNPHTAPPLHKNQEICQDESGSVSSNPCIISSIQS